MFECFNLCVLFNVAVIENDPTALKTDQRTRSECSRRNDTAGQAEELGK
jgi:hypothetical protein